MDNLLRIIQQELIDNNINCEYVDYGLHSSYIKLLHEINDIKIAAGIIELNLDKHTPTLTIRIRYSETIVELDDPNQDIVESVSCIMRGFI